MISREIPAWLDLRPSRSRMALGAAGVMAYLIPPTLVQGPIPASVILASAAALPVLLYISFHDARTLRIPDWATAALAVGGIITIAAVAPGQLATHLLTAGVVLTLLYGVSEGVYRLTGVDALGLGDVKLIAAIAIWLGLSGLLSAIVLASIAGVATCIAMRRTAVAFGPFLAFGFWVTWLHGPVI